MRVHGGYRGIIRHHFLDVFYKRFMLVVLWQKSSGRKSDISAINSHTRTTYLYFELGIQLWLCVKQCISLYFKGKFLGMKFLIMSVLLFYKAIRTLDPSALLVAGSVSTCGNMFTD